MRKLIRASWFVPSPLRKAIAPLISAVAGGRLAPDRGRKAAAAWLSPDALPHPYFFTRALFPIGQIETVIEPVFRASTIHADGVTLNPTWLGWLERAAREAHTWGLTAATAWLEMRTYMASTLLRDTDAVSMARSLEVRVPLLDTPLVEFVQALPEDARQKVDAPKALLIEAVRDVLPPSILGLRKRTFTLPWENWLRNALRPRVELSLAQPSAALAPHLRKDGMLRIWSAFLEGKTSWSRRPRICSRRRPKRASSWRLTKR